MLLGEDIPGVNRCDTALGLEKEYWEPVLAVGKVSYNGQAVALVLADTLANAQRAVPLVKVTYTNIQTPILTVEEAIAANSFFPIPAIGPVKKGDTTKGFNNAKHVSTGRVAVPDQYHFHMETQTTVVFPGDDGDLNLFCSTQVQAAQCIK